MLETATPSRRQSEGTERSELKRFVRALGITNAMIFLPAFWLTFGDWRGRLTFFPTNEQANVYDLQGRALLSGHFNVPTGSLGVEGFLHAGKTYTYFGVFPSLLRLPILAVTHSLDGQMTAVSLFLAWAVTCVATGACLLLVRRIIRGNVVASSLELVTTCALSAAMTAGTIVPSLLACPRVYEEDLAWSIALGLSLLALMLRFFLQPRRRWLVGIAAVAIAAVMTRGSTGVAWLLALVALGLFCQFSRHGVAWKPFAKGFFGIALAAGGLVALVSYLKFGILYGFDEKDQVWTQVYAPRRAFLAANGGTTFGLQFLPTNLLAYFSPVGLFVSGLFPYFQTPVNAAQPIGHVVFDHILPTQSLTASAPMLLGLSLIGTIAVVAKATTQMERVLRILIVATVLATGPVLIFGYIAPRYLGDFVPWMVLAGASGFFWLAKKIEQKAALFFKAVIALSALAVVVNVAAASTMQLSWSKEQATNFTRAQQNLSPSALRGQVSVSPSLPLEAPPGHIVIVGNCAGIYRTLGPLPNISLSLQEHKSWLPLAPTVGASATMSVVITRTPMRGDAELVLATKGEMSVVLRPVDRGVARIVIERPFSQIPPVPTVTPPFVVTKGMTGTVKVTIDPYLQTTNIAGFDNTMETAFAGPGASAFPPVTSSWATVTTNRPMAKSDLCQSILKTKRSSATH